jgi:hypothetical protein
MTLDFQLHSAIFDRIFNVYFRTTFPLVFTIYLLLFKLSVLFSLIPFPVFLSSECALKLL